MRPRVLWPWIVQQMLNIEKAPKAEFTHLTILKHQNAKTSLYKLALNHWVLHFLKFLGPSEKNYNLQSLMITL